MREAVRFAPEHVVDVYLTEAAAERYPEIAGAARDAGLWLHETADDVLAAMSPDAQGVLAVARTWTTSLDDVLAGTAGERRDGGAGTAARRPAGGGPGPRERGGRDPRRRRRGC